ncbi:unnamed protein product [Owenia fusiformis]|uniref:Carboxylic ester hydrolase n=1 Tax=Owenia fusiformis TaxID=6347 RepID=A0A8S4NI21_OWEFU|nr:unnamed protein product [Owenia fusiformis]
MVQLPDITWVQSPESKMVDPSDHLIAIAFRAYDKYSFQESNMYSLQPLDGRDLTYREYLGIPYAEPPVGDLRFRPPKPLKKKWSGVLDATKHGPACMQHEIPLVPPPAKTDEDCLYLDVLTPGNGSNNVSKAVMIWIHAGGYTLRSTRIYDGAKYGVIGDVVVVMMNYRLDIFGFLSTGDDVVPGNMGLLDQHLAIRWVNRNIALFGGDPARITLFGESAGATSVTQQAIAPCNKGLFKRVISQSGTIFSDFAFHGKDMLPAVRKTGTLVNCTDANVTKLIECLQRVNPKALLLASRPPFDAIDIIYGWNPVVDGKFITREPADLLRGRARGPVAKMLRSIDLLIGHNSDEGYRFIQFYAVFQHPNFELWNPSWNEVSIVLPVMEKFLKIVAAKYGDETVAETIYETLALAYFGIHKGAKFNGERLAQIANEIINDRWFLIPALQFANLHAGLGGRTFKYHFIYRPSTAMHPSWVKGADHNAEFVLQFGSFPDDPIDQLVACTMITYWSNFAKTGNPNEPAANPALSAYWPPFTKEKSQNLEISANTAPSQPGEIIKPDRVHFWTEFLPKITATAKCGAKKTKKI